VEEKTQTRVALQHRGAFSRVGGGCDVAYKDEKELKQAKGERGMRGDPRGANSKARGMIWKGQNRKHRHIFSYKQANEEIFETQALDTEPHTSLRSALDPSVLRSS